MATAPAHPSFKTNLNRQKTKRWVEAKSYSYDGDDWGDVDDYDEYGAQSSVPLPVPKPTGLRQKGHGIASPASVGGIRQVDPPGSHQVTKSQPGPYLLADDERNFIPQGAHRQSRGPPAFRQTAPVPADQTGGGQPSATQSSHGSTHLEQVHPGQTQRSFSEGVSQGLEQRYEQPLQTSPTLKVETGVKSYDLGNIARTQPVSQRRVSTQGSILSTGRAPGTRLNPDDRQAEASISPVYLHDRGDDTAPAALAPSYMSSSPTTEAVVATSASGMGYPPRKSSLTHSVPISPESLAGSQPETAITAQHIDPPNANMASRPRAISSPSKPLPFVRPADIYKRIDEEREKERRSLDSDRRSVDSTRSRGPDSESPRRAKGIEERRGSDSRDYSPDAENNRRTTSRLEPVRERKSEYGMEFGLSENEQNKPDPEGLDSPSRGRGFGQNLTPSASTSGPPSAGPPLVNHPSDYTTTITLPDVARLSGFGDTFWSASESPQRAEPVGSDTKPALPLAAGHSSPVQSSASGLPEDAQDGFRSVVDKAFEMSEARSASQTPSVVDEKQNQGVGAEPKRSESASTAGISPIMSRVPVPATFEERLADNGAGVDPNENVVRESSGHTYNLSDGMQIEKPSIRNSLDPPDASSSQQASRPGSAGSPSRSSRYDHKRNLSNSSTNNSPARSAIVEYNADLPEGEAVEVTTASPIDSEKPSSEEGPTLPPGSTGLSGVTEPTQGKESGDNAAASMHDDGYTDEMRRRGGPLQTSLRTLSVSPTRLKESPTWPSDTQTSRASSPTKGRVRDLAEKFENQATSSVSPSSTPNRGSYSEYSKAQEDHVLQRPPPPTSEASFRPALPGGWISFSTVDNLKSSEVQQDGSQPPQYQQSQAEDDVSTDTLDSACKEQSPSDVRRGSALDEAAGSSENRVAEVADPTRGEPSSIPEHNEGPTDESEALTPMPEEETNSPVADPNLRRSEGLLPTPPPKDVVSGEMAPESYSSHFTRPLTPRKLNTSEFVSTPTRKIEADDVTPVPSMSTDASPDDQESDKLRKEIVKSLNFSASPLGSHAEVRHPEYLRVSVESSRLSYGRDSNILPSEYDSYWASTRDREESDLSRVPPHSQRDGQAGNHQEENPTSSNAIQYAADQGNSSLPAQEAPRTTTEEPHFYGTSLPANHALFPGHNGQKQGSTTVDSPDSPYPEEPHAPGSPIASAATGELKPQQLDEPAVDSTSGAHRQLPETSTAGNDIHSVRGEKLMPEADEEEGHGLSAARQMPIMLSRESPQMSASVHKLTSLEQTRSSSIEGIEDMGSSRDRKSLDSTSGKASSEKQVAQAESTGGLDSGSLDQLIRFTESEPAHFQLPDVPQHISEAEPSSLRIGDETDTVHREEFAANANPPEPISKDAAVPTGQQRIPTFQEISAMKTSAERIKAYNSARAYYANLDTGLAVWIASMTSHDASRGGMTVPVPERPRPVLDTTVGPNDSSPKSSSSQPKASNPSPSGIPASGQPYYQQYLTFSDLSPSGRVASGSAGKPLPNPATATSRSGTPSGGRVTTGQVQAKGKELLHSAGVLGGKANVAAKGLFAKGKSKWRASGAEKGDH